MIISLRWSNPASSSYIQQYEISAKRTITHQWVSFDNIPWQLSLAVISSEDQLFPSHHGFDIAQIRKAVSHNKNSSRVRGASTISQQTIKNLYLWPERTYFRKGVEAWLTLWLEILVPKKRILEIYLNIAQFSKSTFGVKASAPYYFGTPLKHLTEDQSIALATCLPAPSRCRPLNPSEHKTKKMAWMKMSMEKLGGKKLIDKL